MVFTGLVQAIGRIESRSNNGKVIVVSCRDDFWCHVKLGESIAIDGVCLTVDEVVPSHRCVQFRLSSETMAKTCPWQLHQAVNIERALQFGDHLGGHITSGHVHTTTRVVDVKSRGTIENGNEESDVWFCLPPPGFPQDAVRYKDSICISGVSLTVAEIDLARKRFRVSLIAKTLQHTTFGNGRLTIGKAYNVEFNRHVNPLHTQPVRLMLCEQDWMRAAMQEAELGRNTTAPNPWVGCVIVSSDGETVLGRGHHVYAGGLHAETEALADAERNGHDCAGSTVYVTLEPCHKFGRQPPCDNALVTAKVGRVVVGLVDPDHRTNGQGCQLLRSAGIEVVTGVCEQEITESLAPYLWARRTGRPYVVAKLALSADGCYTTTGHKLPSITSEASRQHAHDKLRATSQAIIVGSKTVLQDNPQLNVRSTNVIVESQPLRVVIDSKGTCIDPDLHVLQNAHGSCTLIVTCANTVSQEALAIWKRLGVEVYSQNSNDVVDLADVLRHLAQTKDVMQVLVEGGAELQSHFFEAHLINEYWMYQSPSMSPAESLAKQRTMHDAMKWVTSARQLVRVSRQSIGDSGDTLQVFRVEYPVMKTTEEEQEAPACEFDSLEVALTHFRKGGLIVVMDDASRENEGDLVARADMLTEEQMAFIVRHTTGIVCAPMPEERAEKLGLARMVSTDASTDPHQTAFTITCDADGTTTGVSAADRCLTLRALSGKQPAELRKPGHVFPLIAREGGLLTRRGHTEAAVDLCGLAGVEPRVGVIGELNNDQGKMMRYDECRAFAKQFHLPIIHLDQIVDALKANVAQVSKPTDGCLAKCDLFLHKTGNTRFTMATFSSLAHPEAQHRLLLKPAETTKSDANMSAMIRIHSECFTGDVLGSALCDCGDQLQIAIKQIAAHPGLGMIVFPAAHEGRGIGLANKLRAYSLMQQHPTTVDTYAANRQLGFKDDARTYNEAIDIVSKHMNDDSRRILLLTSNPDKVQAFRARGFEVQVNPIKCEPSQYNARYLAAKEEKHRGTNTKAIVPSSAVNPSHPGTYYAKPVDDLRLCKLTNARICVIQAGWHRDTSNVFLQLLRPELRALGMTGGFVSHVVVPGCWEVPLMLSNAMQSDTADCYIVVGSLMKGETLHFEMIAENVARALMDLQLLYRRPVINCILDVYNQKQMEDRFLGKTDMHKSIASTIATMLVGGESV